MEEEVLVDKAIHISTNYKNRFAVTIFFNEWQSAQGWSLVNSDQRYHALSLDYCLPVSKDYIYSIIATKCKIFNIPKIK